MAKPKPKSRRSSNLKPGQLADQLYAARQLRYTLQHTVESMKKNEKQISDKLRVALAKLEGNTVGGRKARVTLESKPMPKVVNWDALYEHIRKTGEFDLLQRRVGEEAVRERWDKREHVPGVDSEPVAFLSVEKL